MECAQCGASGRPDAEFCWRCHARFPGARPSFVPAAAAAVIEASPVAAPAPRRRLPVGTVVTAVALAVAVFLGWRILYSGFSFPATVAGQPRMETEEARRAEELLAAVAQVVDVDMESAFYGSAGAPAYSMVAIGVPEHLSLEGLLVSLAEAQGQGAVVPPVTADGEVILTCNRFPDVGAECIWARDGRYVALQGYGASPETLEPVALEVRRDTGT